MNISALYYDYHDRSGEQYNHINKFVAAGLLYIIGHYFSSWSSYFVLTLCCRDNHTCNFYNDMFHKMFAEWNEWPLQIVIVNNNNYRKIPGARQYNMIFTDSYDAFLEMEMHTYSADSNNNEYYFIFLQTRDKLMFVQKANGRVLIYTYYPFTENHCDEVEIALVNEYNGTSLIHEELFPKKLKNLYGCPLRAALWHVPPYVYLSQDAKNVTYVSGGFEGKLLLELAKKLNFSLEVIVPPNDSKRGVVLQNGSLTGALKLLQERQADLSLGSFRQTKQRRLVLTSSINYFQTIWVVLTLSEAYILNSLETILFPFSDNTWYLLAFTGFIAVVVVVIIKRLFRKTVRKHMDHVTLDVLAILVGMSAQYRPMFNTTRLLNAAWMIFSLIIRTFYQAMLFHLIRNHITRHMPQTLEELVKKNYSLIVNSPTFDAMRKVNLFRSITFIITNDSNIEEPLNYLENLSLKQAAHSAVAIPLILAQHYVEINKKPDVFKILPQKVIDFKLCMYFTKHSFLIEQFDDILMMIKGFGLLKAWLNQEIDENYVKNTHLEANHIFGMKQLKMAFVMLLMGYMIATLQDRKADISLGSFQQTKQRREVVTSTITYYQTSWVIVTLSEAFILTSLETMLYPFTIGTWYLLALMCVFAMGLVALLRRKFQKTILKNTSLDVIAMLLGLPAQYTPIFQSTRILSATWMMFSLILRTVYQALLFHVIRTHITRNVPQTLDELVEQNYSLVVEPGTFNALQKVSLFNNTEFITLYTPDDTKPLVYLEELPLSRARYTAAALPLIFQQYYTDVHNKVNVFRVLPNTIMHLKLGIFLSKHSYLIDQLDYILGMLKGYSLIEAWYKQEVDLQDRQADLSLGSFRQTSARDIVATSTMNYFQTGWSVVTMSEAYILTSLEIILFPFSNNTWCILVFLCAFALSVVNLTKWIFRKLKPKHLDQLSLDILLMLLGMPALYIPFYNASRILNITWMIFSLILRTVYQALMFHFIRTHVTRNMPQTLEELLQKNYSMIVNLASAAALNEVPLLQSLNFLILNTSLDTLALDYLESLPQEKAKHSVAAIPYAHLQYHIENFNKGGLFKVLPHTIMSLQMCIYTSKHSFLIDQLNEDLMLLRGFGILLAWYRQEINTNYLKERHLVANHIFGFKQLKMAFIFLIIGHIVAMGLKNREADLSMGSFRETYKRSQVATSTINYFQSVIATVSLSDAYLLTSMETILYPFSTHTWYLILLILFAAILAIIILKHFCKSYFKNDNNQNILKLFELLLGISSKMMPQRNFTRILNMSWMIYALILRVVYEALLFRLIRTHVKRHIPQTLEQLAEENYSIIINKIGINSIEDIEALNALNILLINTTSETLPLEFLEKLPLQQARTTVTIAPLVVAQYYAHHFRKMSVFQLLPDNVMSFEVCIYLSKHSFLIDQLNDILIWTKSFGLLEAWYHAEIDLNLLHHEHDTTDRLFGLQQLYMAFVILVCGYIVALLIFIWELLRHKYQYFKFVRK
ncbi:putative glutamate receptor [Lucilia cuprina]|nr:putative glutamate receptor [Lucilia cuprina]